MDGEAILLKEGGELDAFSSRLPRSVRFLGASSQQAAARPQAGLQSGLYEFEVVSGNAAYREGERFYLTPTQAQRAYPMASP